MITDVPGVQVGHQTMVSAATGCTVVLLPEGTVASGEVRGGAPATREFALLDPINLVQHVDAVVLSGGSAFGLACADGVMGWLEAKGRGFSTAGGRVPIVVGMSLYDLTTGDGSQRPTAVTGESAAHTADVANGGPYGLGLVGAGTGATTAKWLGPDGVEPGGIGSHTVTDGDLIVSALMAVNAYGVINAAGGQALELGPRHIPLPDDDAGSVGDDGGCVDAFANTTIGLVVTNAKLDKADCFRVAKVGHGGLARAITPAHTPFDGDALVAAATGQVDADPVFVQMLAQRCVEQAIRSLGAS